MSWRVAILGPGAVGGMLAVRLAQTDAEVVCVTRPDAAAAIRSEGLTLRQGESVATARPEAVEELREPVDLLLITVKAPALADALDRVAARATAVVPLMNGLEHVEAIRRRLDANVIAGSIGRLEAYREGRTRIVQATASPLVTLAAADGVAERLTGAGLDVRIGESERAVLWDKLARLAPLAAATAATQRSLGELRADPEWRVTLEAAVAEACAVAGAEGVILTTAAQWETLDTMPASVTTSTARDAAAGSPTELDAHLGAVVRAARRLDVPAPTLERLLVEAEDACQALSR